MTARDPRVNPAPGDWLTDGRSDVVVDDSDSNGDVLVRRFRSGEDEVHSASRVPLDVYRRDAVGTKVLTMGLPS